MIVTKAYILLPKKRSVKTMIEKELKIREVCGDYALDIPFADGSKPNNDLHDYCPYCGTKIKLGE